MIGYQYCTEMVQPFSRGDDDMFFSQPWDQAASDESCYQQWGVHQVSWSPVSLTTAHDLAAFSTLCVRQ